jgi:hypothetical protein
MRRRFDKAEVDYLVAEPKFIKDLPLDVVQGNYRVIEAAVYRKGDPPVLIPSLAVNVRVPMPIAGIPVGIPGAALRWYGHRIRGLDRETQHDNPDGSIVRGWHEHLWSLEWGDSLVRTALEPKRKNLRGVFKHALNLWNIKVIKEQMEVE